MTALFSVFITVLIAEIGDKTQIATMLFSTNSEVSRRGVFLAASAALVASTALAVIAGDLIVRVVAPSLLKTLAGIGFIAVGVWTLLSS
jgi:putative Ca2+/H+ antiporter (TMEM165/GDT1 family)